MIWCGIWSIYNDSVHLLIKQVLRIILLVIINHDCLRKKHFINKKCNNELSLFDTIKIFNSVWLDWFSCINCRIKSIELTVSGVCSLFVYNKNRSMVPCVDLKVYGVCWARLSYVYVYEKWWTTTIEK